MDLLKSIKKLRVTALLLFVLPTVAIFGSLIFHNYLISFNFLKIKFNFSKNIPGKISFTCTPENEYCKFELDRINNLNECCVNQVDLNI